MGRLQPLYSALLPAVVTVLLLAPVAGAQSNYHLDLEVGYQVLDISGNEEMYRSQIDEDDGLVLRRFSLDLFDPEGEHGLFDHLLIDAAGFGGSPDGRLRIKAGLADAYRLRLLYQHFEHFSALPGLANPYLEDGIVPGQHTSDRDQEIVDLELQLLPGRWLSPLIGYRWMQNDGLRTTTYHVGGDEFQVGSDLRETETELRAGLVLTGRTFRGTIIQGWRELESRDRSWLLTGAGDGNNQRPVLGLPVELEGYSSVIRNEAEAPVTTAHLTGTLGDATRLTATFVRADYEGEGWDDSLLGGSLVSFRLARFFSGLEQSIRSRTESPAWRGEVRVESRLTDWLTLDAGLSERSRKLDGWNLVSSIYQETLNLSGTDPGDLVELVEAETSYERQDRQLDLRLDARGFGPARFWAGWSTTDQEITVDADPVQILVPGSQSGSFDRTVDSYELGAAVTVGGLDASLGWQSEDADLAIVRTDFRDRQRLRLRVGWRHEDLVRIVGTAEQIELDNRAQGIGYDATIDHYAINFAVTPVEQLTLRLGYDTYQSDSEIVIRSPQDFLLEPSLHSEDATLLEAGLLWHLDRWSVDAAISRLDNDGSFAFTFESTELRFGYELTETIGLAVELATAEYAESDLLTLGDFDADRYGLFLRWHR